MILDGHQFKYECPNGHINEKHKSLPAGHERTPACVECDKPVYQVIIPLRECDNCGTVWPYTGDADRPTCPSCKGKRTEPVSS